MGDSCTGTHCNMSRTAESREEILKVGRTRAGDVLAMLPTVPDFGRQWAGSYVLVEN